MCVGGEGGGGGGEGGRGQRPRKFWRGEVGGGGGVSVNLRFQMVMFDDMQICFKIVSYLLFDTL